MPAAEPAGGSNPAAELRPQVVLYLHSSAGHYGADRQLLALVEGLDRARYRALVHLAQDGPLATDLRRAGAKVEISELAVVRRELLNPKGLLRLLTQLARSRRMLKGVVEAEGVALIHSNTSVILGGAAAARSAGIPHVWHVREIYSDFASFWRAFRPVLLSASRLLCVSEAVANQFGAAGPARAPKVQVLHDGMGLVPRQVPQDEARKALDLPEGAFVCAVLGRISPWKGQALLVEALAQAKLPEDSILVIAGDSWASDPKPSDDLRALASRLGIADRLRLTGFIEDVSLVYAAADVVVVPSTQPDPLPNTAIEAAAAGRCVLAADHGGLSEIIKDGETGLLFKPADAAALAAGLSTLAREPKLRDRLAAAAKVDALARFSPARLASETQKHYDDLLGC